MKKVKQWMILPLMAILVLSACKKEEEMADMPTYKSSSYDYAFNTGQVGAGTAYDGMHPKNLTAKLMLEEQADGKTKVTLTLMNTVDGEMYMVHAHDAADPNTTPNGTPYNETPNSSVLVGMVNGNGGTVSYSQVSSMSYADLTATYSGFLVVHDPMQSISTTDLTTYLVVGSFSR
ncbi:MAG: hypothetical protein EP332_13385 [Bacteroidetes bacterium]|nr:MAG: hypothetical protein EP332_13385 [Bacteroidota bacterium]